MQIVWYAAGAPYVESQAIRRAVFIEEQGYSETEEFDDLDAVSPHVVLFDEAEPIATGRLILEPNGIAKLGRIAVLKTYRGKHCGQKIVASLLERAKKVGAVTAKISSKTHAVPFYETFGFQAYGDVYLEGNIPHIAMQMQL